MKRKQLVPWYWAGAVILALGAAATAGPRGLIGYWTFDEGQGTTAFDSSGNGLHGTLRSGPTWVAGQVGGALDFNGSTAYVEIPDHPLLAITTDITIAAWTNMRNTSSGEMAIISKGGWAVNDLPYELTEERGGVIFWQFYNDAGRDTCSPNSPRAGEWHHIAATYDGKIFKCYIDGALGEQWAYAGAMPKNTAALTIGRRSRGGTFFNGMIDDVQLWARALPEPEIKTIMAGLVDASLAQDPDPENEALDVPRDAVLSWTPGKTAATHDVYFGTVFADVNNATRTNPTGLLASKGQTGATFDPAGLLSYGQTYYWRVDEVNQAPDNTIFKGQVWSFTAEPYGYPVKPAKATASSYQPGMGPERTLDGSGLTGDLHGTEPTTMWLSAGAGPNWIQYEFDKVYKLYQLKAWNSNQLVEAFLGFSARKVTVETSLDGATWTSVANSPEFSRAPGTPGYAANTTVNLGPVDAKFVKLTITANWGGMAPQTGLAEVRFTYAPTQAFQPQPANAATGVSVDTALDWRPGREATSHQVYLGTDLNAVTAGTAAVKTVTNHGFAPGPLELGTKYYWKVTEVGAATYPGEVWSFTTQDYRIVDDFESYTSKTGEEVFAAWVDGFDNPAKNGAVVGLATAANGTFGDTTTFHGGKQSMPLAYDSTKAPLSEATRTFASGQDWTTSGIKTLVLFFYGDTANTGTELYVKINGTKVAYAGKVGDLARRRWNQWNIDLSGLPAATLRSVKTLAIGITGGSGKLLIDDIRLYRLAPEVPAALNPGTNGLVALYAMTNNVQDTSGKGNNGTAVGAPTYVAGLSAYGTALKLNGTTDCVNLGNKPVFNFAGSFSLSVWANIGAWTSNWNHVMVGNRGESNIGWQLRRRDSNKICFTTRGVSQDDTGSTMDAPLNEWVHIAAVYDNAANTKRIYVNGIEDAFVTTTAGKVAATTHNTFLGARANSGNTGREGYFTGMLDEVRIFDRALSAGEVEFLSNPAP